MSETKDRLVAQRIEMFRAKLQGEAHLDLQMAAKAVGPHEVALAKLDIMRSSTRLNHFDALFLESAQMDETPCKQIDEDALNDFAIEDLLNGTAPTETQQEAAVPAPPVAETLSEERVMELMIQSWWDVPWKDDVQAALRELLSLRDSTDLATILQKDFGLEKWLAESWAKRGIKEYLQELFVIQNRFAQDVIESNREISALRLRETEATRLLKTTLTAIDNGALTHAFHIVLPELDALREHVAAVRAYLAKGSR